MIGCCCGEGNSKIYRSFILRRNNLFYHFLRPGQGQAIRKRMVLPAKLSPAARKSKNISLSNLVIFSTIQILTSPGCYHGPYIHDSDYNPVVPKIENGYYCFVDRHSQSKDKKDDSPLLNRYSINCSLAIYDTDTNLLYYLELDT